MVKLGYEIKGKFLQFGYLKGMACHMVVELWNSHLTLVTKEKELRLTKLQRDETFYLGLTKFTQGRGIFSNTMCLCWWRVEHKVRF